MLRLFRDNSYRVVIWTDLFEHFANNDAQLYSYLKKANLTHQANIKSYTIIYKNDFL